VNRSESNGGKNLGDEYNRLSHAIIGAAIEVHRTLGPGFLESVYEEALCLELQLRNIKFTRQFEIGIAYKGHTVGSGRVDVLVNNAVIVELKAIDAVAPIHTAQVLSYLRMTGCKLGLLINFNVPALKDGIHRIALSAALL
jgi:GxxExxY protein